MKTELVKRATIDSMSAASANIQPIVSSEHITVLEAPARHTVHHSANANK